MATNGTNNHDISTDPSRAQDTSNSGNKDLPKDEVGWYFVEQYYTTLSKSPEKLHLFYSKQSQFVYGQEAEVSPIAVGRPAIQERIKELDFDNCKVRISNVDSQGSDEHIVIQAIGETSNKGGEPKKFVQTFVLAKQPSGYFVLNDILRYINEEPEEESEEATQPVISEAPGVVETEEQQPEPEAPAPEEPVQEAEPAELDAAAADHKQEEVAVAEPEESAPAVEAPAVEAAVEVEEPAKEKAESIPDPEKVAEEVAEEAAKTPEEPKDPNPTPAVPAVAQAPVVAEPEKPKEPPKPMTWASRAAAAAGPPRPVPVVPLPKTATPPAAAQTRPSGPAAAPARPAEPTPAAAPAPAKDQDSEWQTAETKRQNRPQSMSATPVEKEGTMAYIKYVTEKVRDEDLRGVLAGFGELAYFDINRQKNCAFVEFKTQAGYNAAVAANPHTVNGENIIVEQRRPKANAYGGTNYSTTRGGVAGRGRGGYDGARTGSQGSGRGSFTGQARGSRGGAPRGRGPSQASAP